MIGLICVGFGPLGFSQAIDLRQEISRAASISDSLKRLAAYDDIAARAKLTRESNAETNTSGYWSIDRSVSPIDDSVTINAYLASENKVSTRLSQNNLALIVRYQEGELNAFISFRNFMGSDAIDTTMRFDREPAFEISLTNSTDHTAGFIPRPWRFIEKLAKTNSLTVRATPYGESPVTVTFNVAGFSDLLPQFEAASKTGEKSKWDKSAAELVGQLRNPAFKPYHLEVYVTMGKTQLTSAPTGADTGPLEDALKFAQARIDAKK